MKYARILLFLLLCTALAIALPQSSNAQFGKLKDKAKKAVEKKISGEEVKKEEAQDTTAGADEDGSREESKTPPPAGEQFQLFTKFDYVPGQTVLFYDDLSGEELGEFPSRWSLDGGVFEIAKVGQDNWIMASARGGISPKINVNQLPEKFTVEFEFLNRTAVYGGAYNLQIGLMRADGYAAAHLELFTNTSALFFMADENGNESRISDKKLPESFKEGIHTIRVMVTKSSVKCYVDNERVANAPRTAGFTPVSFLIKFHADDGDLEKEKLFIRNFRFAEGGKTMREQLDESGKIVTHGIYFDVNSDQIKGESYKTLADIGSMLTDDAALKLAIEGHTDSDGSDASNLELSQRRAESVKKYLVDTYKVDASRLDPKGMGETKPIDANTTPEGKANNRRVELVKI
ncbi:MAG: OmpA family protein [candidate division Zixibacteria bacterium]|nr:OmpA family protein [candidate division Zixibacteria bacterium]